MLSIKPPLKLLMSGLDEPVISWFRSLIKANKLPWRLRTCEPIRIGAPENQLGQHDIVVVAWSKLPSVTLAEALKRTAPQYRSLEGVLSTIEEIGGDELSAKTIIIGQTVTREDALLLAEHGIRTVLPLHEKPSKWNDHSQDVIERIYKLHEENSARSNDAKERIVDKFVVMLTQWQKLSDELKMKAVDDLLNTLGDSPRYAELVARKCICEKDFAGAERWLNRAISKNANYLKALHLLADVYFQTGRYDDALKVLDKVKANSPRSLKTLMKIGKCYFAKNEPLKAEKHLCDALAIDEFHQVVREELGKVKFVLQEFETARKLFENSQSPREIAAHLNKIGIQLVEQGKYQNSIEHYRWAQFVLPGNDQSHLLFFNIALAYAKWGRLSEAMSYARLAKTKTPEYEKADHLIDKIEKYLQKAA